jgi:hypothetical protein
VSSGAHPGRDHLTWVGHGTVVVAMGGTRVIVDPVLRPRVLHLKRFHPVPKHALRSLDAALITHQHHDHLDPPSLESLGKDLPIIVPAGAAGTLRRKRFTQVIEIAEGERIQIGQLRATATPADHDARRDHPLGPVASPIGYLFEGSKRIYVAGDTDLFDEMELIGPVDYAMLPIFGWGPGLGPGGAQLYPVAWLREPYDSELAPYLATVKRLPSGASADIACRMAEHNRVENCQILGESPRGTGLAKALRLAAWQFLVKPPRIDNKPQLGVWVRIHFDFGVRVIDEGTAPSD